MTVFLDLDNTLVDRDGAFARWAQEAVRSWGGDATDAAWLIDADAHGYTPRSEIAQLIINRFAPTAAEAGSLVSRLLYEHVDYVECYPGVLSQLGELVAIGEQLVIVSNGDGRQQRMKLERTGLAEIVAGSAISGDLGVKKPDARIFAAARDIAGGDGLACMVGDNIEADIAGARAAGFATAWVSHGRPWTEPWMPTLTESNTAALLASVAGQVLMREESNG
ncbi:HAD family hydrolase [Agreia pratensis]|uniref:HAD family hydrolase n=1 Tax=Agreia pratensis TaxID=150121 RepID=UPI00188DAC54|nr:HAD family hydrolase [Agreia pratensis]MBF4634949.1 HAD family hydrolase [Agreia pratensis]